MRPTKASEMWRDSTTKEISPTRAMDMMVTSAIETESAQTHSVKVSLGLCSSW